jgi:hypothetical protein
MKPMLPIARHVVIRTLNVVYRLAVFGFVKGQRCSIVSTQIFRLFALVLFPLLVLRATTIVGIWTENRVVIAADSKQTMSSGRIIIGSRDACKLYQIGDFIMAIAGVAEAEEVNIVSRIRDFPREYTDASGKKLPLVRISVAAQLSIQEVIDNRAKSEGRDPRAFDPAGYDPALGVSLLIAGVSEDAVVMSRIDEIPTPGFRTEHVVGSNGVRNVEVSYPKDRGREDTNPNRAFEILGIKSAISKFRSILPTEWNVGDDVAVARRLVAV